MHTVFSLNSGPLAKWQLKHLRTSQNSLQVVRLDSSVLKSIPISFEMWNEKAADLWNDKLTGPAGQSLKCWICRPFHSSCHLWQYEGNFHFAKGTFHYKTLKSTGNFFQGHQGQDQGNRGHYWAMWLQCNSRTCKRPQGLYVAHTCLWNVESVDHFIPHVIFGSTKAISILQRAPSIIKP